MTPEPNGQDYMDAREAAKKYEPVDRHGYDTADFEAAFLLGMMHERAKRG